MSVCFRDQLPHSRESADAPEVRGPADLDEKHSKSVNSGSVPDAHAECRARLLDALFEIIKPSSALGIKPRSPGFNLRTDPEAFAQRIGYRPIGIKGRLERICEKLGDLQLRLRVAAPEGELAGVQFGNLEQFRDAFGRNV